MIVDASVILQAFFPDETQDQAQAVIRDHVAGHTPLVAPSLIIYEVTNAVVQAIRRGRITEEDGEAVLTAFEGLGIEIEPVAWQSMLPLAQRFGRSAYDAAYLALAEARGEPLVTGDRRLYRAIRGDWDQVLWIGSED